MATADQFIAQAAKYIGISGTNNIFNTWYWGHACYDPDVYPWCATFQSYVGVHDLDMPFKPSASAAGVAWQGTRVKDKEARKGDWVLFNWDGRQDFSRADHIGVIEWSDINGSGYFGTIEGNTGGGEGSVMRQTRYNWGSYGTAFFRPPYKEEPMPKQKWWTVQSWEINYSDAQKWIPSWNADGTLTLISKANGMALDIDGAGSKDGTKVQAYVKNGTDAQKFKIFQVEKNQGKKDYTRFHPIAPIRLAPLCAPDSRIEIAGASHANGAKVQIKKKNTTTRQNWSIIVNNDNTWMLVNWATKKALDLAGGGK